MALDAGIGDQLSTGALSAFHTSIARVNEMGNNLTHGMGLAVINIAQVGALTGAAMLARQSDPGYLGALRTSIHAPESDTP